MACKDLAQLVLISAIFGASFLFIRIAAPVTGPLPVAAGRVALGVVVPITVLAWHHRLGELSGGGRNRLGDLLVVGTLLAAAPFTLFAVAELRVSASLAVVLNATTPMWGILVAAVWLGQAVTVRRLGGAIIGAAGVFTAVGLGPLPRDVRTLAAAGACLLAALCYALGSTWVARRLADLSPAALAAGQQLAATALLAGPTIAVLAIGQPLADETARATAGALAAIAMLGVVCTGLAFVLWFGLLARVGPVAAVTVTLLAPVFGVAWAAVFLGEPITPGLAVGTAAVLGGVVLITGRPPSPAGDGPAHAVVTARPE